VQHVNILEAMADPNLLGFHFAAESWRPWKAAAAALFALPFAEPSGLALYRHATQRVEPPDRPFREAYFVVGRRGGKSQFVATVAVYAACFVTYTAKLAAGERAVVAVIAADRSQAQVVFRFIRALLDSSPMLRALVKAETRERIELTNGCDIEVTTCSYRTTRGRTYAAVIADELAFWRDETTATPDSEVIAAVKPGLVTLDGLLIGVSSPYARRGVLWDMYSKHFGRDSEVLLWKATSREMNENIPERVVEKALEEDEPRARAEYIGEFRSDIESYVSRDAVTACVASGRRELLPAPGVEYYAFCDPSGGASDSMTLAVAHRENGRAFLDCVREVRPPFSPEQVVIDFAKVLSNYHLAEVRGDRYGAEWVAERFARERIQYIPSALTKSDIYRELLPALNSGHVELLDLPRLVGQVCALERRTARGGRDTIDHAPSAHDDLANAAAGALVAAGGASRAVAEVRSVVGLW
jgi:hypothetical protein